MATRRAVTTHDVAAAAGVSQPTVSLVLSENPKARVSARTRERVLRAAAELGYRPNLVARSLVRGRSEAIGVLVPDLTNPFFVDVVSGVERVATEAGYAVLLADARETPPEQHVASLRARLIDGLILDAVGATSLPESALESLKVVVIDEPSERHPGIASDALSAGRLAGEHLLGLGHRDFAFLGPASTAYAFRMRERGFVGALRGAGLALSSERLVRVPATVGGGRAGMKRLLALGPRPTAVFCANDLVALGALKALAVAGLSAPADVSVMGCDDIEMARIVTPELSTVTIPAREIGARAARLLLRRLTGQGATAAKLLPVRVAARGTTGAPPAG